MRTQWTRLGWVAPVLAVMLGTGAAGMAADRVVICEEFMRTTCSYCPTAGQALDLMLNQYPDDFISLQIHTSGYTTTWGNQRYSYYSINAVPWAWFDGQYSCRGIVGSVQDQFALYRTVYQTCMSLATDVTIDLQAYMVSSNELKVVAEIGVEATGADKNVQVQVVQLLDHWPASPTWCRNGVKQGQNLGAHQIKAGNSIELDQQFTLDAESLANPDNVKVVVFAQTAGATGPAVIYNGAFLVGPFDLDPGDMNCDGKVDFGDINPFVLALTNAAGYAAAFPDCDIRNADINLDGKVDFGDINPFVYLLTAP